MSNNDIILEGCFIEFLKSIKSNSLKGELFNIIVSLKLEGEPPLQVSERARTYLILISAIIEGTNKNNDEVKQNDKSKEDLSQKRREAVQKRWAKENTKNDFVDTKLIQNENLYIQNEYKNDTKLIQNENLYIQNEDFVSQQKEKETKKEKKSTPHTPLKEKEINKEKEKSDVAVDTRVRACEEEKPQSDLNTQQPNKEKEKNCGQKEKESKIQPKFEDEIFNKPLPNENQKNINDWNGDDIFRFKQNLNEVVNQKSWREFSKEKFKQFTTEEKNEIIQEFVLRNALERKYTAIFYDRDMQNEIRKHLINFLNIKLTKKQEQNANNSTINDKTIGREYITQFKTRI